MLYVGKIIVSRLLEKTSLLLTYTRSGFCAANLVQVGRLTVQNFVAS